MANYVKHGVGLAVGDCQHRGHMHPAVGIARDLTPGEIRGGFLPAPVPRVPFAPLLAFAYILRVALDRYRQQPYDVLIIDAGTTGEDGLWLFDRVRREAKRQRAFCAGVLILSESQRDWVDKVEARGAVSILVRPVTLKQLHHEVNELLATQSAEM